MAKKIIRVGNFVPEEYLDKLKSAYGNDIFVMVVGTRKPDVWDFLRIAQENQPDIIEVSRELPLEVWEELLKAWEQDRIKIPLIRARFQLLPRRKWKGRPLYEFSHYESVTSITVDADILE